MLTRILQHNEHIHWVANGTSLRPSRNKNNSNSVWNHYQWSWPPGCCLIKCWAENLEGHFTFNFLSCIWYYCHCVHSFKRVFGPSCHICRVRILDSGTRAWENRAMYILYITAGKKKWPRRRKEGRKDSWNITLFCADFQGPGGRGRPIISIKGEETETTMIWRIELDYYSLLNLGILRFSIPPRRLAWSEDLVNAVAPVKEPISSETTKQGVK